MAPVVNQDNTAVYLIFSDLPGVRYVHKPEPDSSR